MIGILNNFGKSRFRAYNTKNAMICALAACNAVLYAKLLYESNTFEEYVNLIYNCSSAAVFTFIFIVIIWKTLELYDFINKLEKTVQKRKCDQRLCCACRMNKGFIFAVSGITHLQQRMIYGEASEKIQKLMGNVHLGLVKVIPLFCTLPSFVISFTTYFVTDLGNDAFQLPYRMW